MRFKNIIFTIVLLSAFAAGAFADIIEMTDGRTIEGKVILKNAEIVRVKTRYGTIDLAADTVKSITPKKTIDEIFDDKKAASKTADDFATLAKWCSENGFKKETREMYQKAVALDPKHEAANRALGNVKDGDDWVTPEEKQKRAADREKAAKEAEGLVLYEGKWVTKVEKDYLERGYVKFNDQWMPFEQAQRAKGLVKSNGEWVAIDEAIYRERSDSLAKTVGAPAWKLVITKHYAVSGSIEESLIKNIAVGAEAAHAYIDGIYGGDGGGGAVDANVPAAPWTEPARPGTSRLEIILVTNKNEYIKTLDAAIEESWELKERQLADHLRNEQIFGVTSPCGRVVCIAEPGTSFEGAVYHQLGHVLARRHAFEMSILPPWLTEAIACLSEYGATGGNTVFCSSEIPKDSGTVINGRKRIERPAIVGKYNWKEDIKSGVAAGKTRPFVELINKRLGELEIVEIEKGMGILEFLHARDPKSVDKLQRRLWRLYGREEISRNAKSHHDDALGLAAKFDTSSVEIEFKRWLPSLGK
ncbi:MAG: hypothetical protein HY286_13680 [Planctomycetes bacterium]|nr:hypothetical protein [Planctomycetota bacterium]